MSLATRDSISMAQGRVIMPIPKNSRQLHSFEIKTLGEFLAYVGINVAPSYISTFAKEVIISSALISLCELRKINYSTGRNH